jgi:hypothetical protein
MKLIDKDNNKQAIIAYLTSGDDDDLEILTDKQKSLLKYYSRAYDLIRGYNSVPDAIKVLVKLASELGEPISQSTARRYVYDAQDVYGYASKTKAEAIAHLTQEIIKDAIAMAWRQNDPDAMIRGAKELYAQGGVAEDTGFNPEMFEQHVIELGMDTHSLEMMEQITGKGLVDLDTISGVMGDLAEDAVIVKEEQDHE